MMRNLGRLFLVMAGLGLVLAGVALLSVRVASGVLLEARMEQPQAHRAVYDLSLEHADPTSGIVSLEGRMVVEWRGGRSCDGYTSEQRVVTRSRDDTGQVSVSDVRLSAWESVDGDEFRFDRTEYLDGVLGTQEFGTAKREDGQVVLALEYGDPIVLPPDVLFPNAFNLQLTSAIRRGRSSFVHSLFDGAQKSASNVTAFFGGSEDAPADARQANAKNVDAGIPLTAMRVRLVHMSYFDRDADVPDNAGDTPPSFEMGFSVFPNGVMSNLRMVYPDAVIKGELKDIEYFKPGSC
jgi:hypothetical protein